ncbi:hypothetical protein KB20921_27810 [Edwardsiella ictaluri]|nr:hypothetical protein KH20906_27680 [Edwardsiella ictaluri]BEI03520.1 hypothetical protein KB20921_27810 [Edwardsiella ictaluri]BEI06981.1 hypothetical protein KH201010_27670 [Edwardsiella ictaluri]BEI10452.1 hypothetical protein STU22726_27830 [Edwardsiella ictaluri]BEI13929.1 hypothetical protein STU22816_27820 [Edwardsiella ictaluri]
MLQAGRIAGGAKPSPSTAVDWGRPTPCRRRESFTDGNRLGPLPPRVSRAVNMSVKDAQNRYDK